MLYFKIGIVGLCFLLGSCAQDSERPTLAPPIADLPTPVLRTAQLNKMTPLLEQINSLPSRYSFAWLPRTQFHLSSFEEIDFVIDNKTPLALLETVEIEQLEEEVLVLAGRTQSSYQRVKEQRHYFPLSANRLLLVDFSSRWLNEEKSWTSELDLMVLQKEEETWTVVKGDLPSCVADFNGLQSESYLPVWASWQPPQLHLRLGEHRKSLTWKVDNWACEQSNPAL